ncbi:MAG: response regulator transcription factor [Opitutae bacterium]
MPSPAKVLIVDDEPHVRTYVSRLAKATLENIEVLQAGDDTTALALYAQHRPELVLLDINLIGSSGLEVLTQLLALNPDAVVIMLTAINVRHTIEDAMAKGASGYILKDSSFEEMTEALREVVRTSFLQ